MTLEPDEIERVDFPITRRGYDTQSVRAFLETVAMQYRQALRQHVPPPPPPSSADQLGDRVAVVLNSAAEVAEQVKAAAVREGHEIRTAASEEAAEAVQAAMRQLEMANEARVAAEKEAEAIRAAARFEAGRVEQEAREQAAAVEQEGREKAARLERATNANVAAVLGEARTRYERLRAAEQKAGIRLATVESLVRQAREEVAGGDTSQSADEVMADTVADATPGVITLSATEAESRQADGNTLETPARPRPPRRAAPLGAAGEDVMPRPRRGRT